MRGRILFLAVMFVVGLAAVAWAVLRVQLPPADFTFINETEVKSLDWAAVTGLPEHRIIGNIFEGLTRLDAKTLEPLPGVAESWDISDDKTKYTFHLRKNARWSNGEPVTAHDFMYSLRRFLDPQTAAEYAYQAWYIVNAHRYSQGGKGISAGDRVEVELNEPPKGALKFARGEALHGKLVRIDGEEKSRTYVVEIDGHERKFRAGKESDPAAGIEACTQVLLDFNEVGAKALDDYTIEMQLDHPTPYWLTLLSYNALLPANQKCIETYGTPAWTYADNIVTNGPYSVAFRRIRDRIRLVKNKYYWDPNRAKLNVIDALAVNSEVTTYNLFATKKVDWITNAPAIVLRELIKTGTAKDVFNPQPYLGTYYYLLNTTRKPLDDPRVRRALALALDREEITRTATGSGEVPAYSLVPLGIPGYTPEKFGAEDVKEAQRLLAEAGYPDGRGFPKMEILYNLPPETHKTIAQIVRKQWEKNLGITVSTRNEEWGSYQTSVRQLEFDAGRRAWIADYSDPNSHLDLMVTGGENNNTGWSNKEYDKLIEAAKSETDAAKRLEIFHKAERILMDEVPVVPIYYYVDKNQVNAQFRGFYRNPLDEHPLSAIYRADDPPAAAKEQSRMVKYIFKRLGWMLLTLWVVFTVSFFLMRSVPGGPFDSDRRLEPEIEQNMLRRYHLDEPLPKQYLRELSNALRGDLGYPYKIRDYTVNGVIAEGLPISAALGLLALTFALSLGLVAGITSASRRGSFADWSLMTLATIGIALPNFVIAGIAILLFVFLFPIFPAAGWGSFSQLVLPALCLGAPHAADVARITRTSMLDVLSQDHIRTARAKGLSRARVIWGHALPGALLPVVSYLGPATAYILTGSLVIEQIFAIPGLGSHFVQAALDRDYTLAMGCVLLYTLILSAMNMLVDLSYTVLDPRVELN